MEVGLLLCALGGLGLLLAPHVSRSSPIVRRLVIYFAMFNMIRYAWWRVTATLPPMDWSPLVIFAYGLVGLELLGTIGALREAPIYFKKTNRTPEVDRQLDWYGAAAPRIDIFIPTYNEPWSVLERTLVGATEQHYPNYAVWILDDGRRDWLKEKAAEWKVGYITRPTNTHYKAGNINNGLSHLRAQGVALEFLAVLDADFVARPEFVRRTVSLMVDETIAIVQTPQWFYNPDPFQQRFGGVLAWPDEQRHWFDENEAALDAVNQALCCGTSCLVRVSALDELGGGFPTESITEDTFCSLRLSRLGWKTRFLNEPLSVGLAPEGLDEYLKQRERWMIGWLEITRYFGKGRTLKSHFNYWLFMWRMAIFGFVRVAWIASHMLYWFWGFWLIQVPAIEAFSFMAPVWLDRLFLGWLYSGRRLHFVNEVHFSVQSFMLMRTVVKNLLFSTRNVFTVTAKAVKRSGVIIHWTTLRWLLLMGLGLSAGIAYNVFYKHGPVHHDSYLAVNVGLSLYVIMQLVGMGIPTVEKPRQRTDDRYPTREPVTLSADGVDIQWRCRNLCVGGVLIELDSGFQPPERATVRLAGVGPLEARMVRRPAANLAAYAFESPQERRALIRKIYCSDGYVPIPERWSLTRAGVSFLRAVFLK
jgi:cellulose synthase (UDP-forming)